MKQVVLFCLGLSFGGFFVSATAAHLTLEVYGEASAQQKKKYIVSSTLNATRARLKTVAISNATRKAVKFCTDLGGRPSEFTCLRHNRFEEVSVWGGRVGYRAYEYQAKVSLKCEVDSDRLNWAERNWYSWVYSTEDACPSYRVMRSESS